MFLRRQQQDTGTSLKAAALDDPQLPQVIGLLGGLGQDADSGDLNKSATRLLLAHPAIARRAAAGLGPEYTARLKNNPDVHYNGFQGDVAVRYFFKDRLKPLLLQDVADPPPHAAAARKRGLMAGVSKLVRLGTLAVALTFLPFKTSMAETPETANIFPLDAVTLVENAPAPAAAISIYKEADTAEIRALKDEMAKTPLGVALLEYAARRDVSIVHSDKLADKGQHAIYNSYKKTAALNPDLPIEDQVVYLAHELRHAWQHGELDYQTMEDRLLSPEQAFALRQHMEADAHAFSAYFWADRMEKLGTEPDPGTAEYEFALACIIREEFRSDDGMTLHEYRDNVLRDAFNYITHYHSKHLSLAMAATLGTSENLTSAYELLEGGEPHRADIYLGVVKDRLATTPDQAAFEKYLRRLGGTSMDPAAPTSLQDAVVTTQDVLDTMPLSDIGTGPVVVDEGLTIYRPNHYAHLKDAQRLFEGFRENAESLTALVAQKREPQTEPDEQIHAARASMTNLTTVASATTPVSTPPHKRPAPRR